VNDFSYAFFLEGAGRIAPLLRENIKTKSSKIQEKMKQERDCTNASSHNSKKGKYDFFAQLITKRKFLLEDCSTHPKEHYPTDLLSYKFFICVSLTSFIYAVSKLDIQSAEKEIDNQQLLLEEEKVVATCLAALISDLSGPKGWVPMEKLHSEVCHGRKIYFFVEILDFLSCIDTIQNNMEICWHI